MDRAPRDDVERVYKSNPGYVIGNAPDGSVKLEDFGGMPYKDWLQGKPFPAGSEMRNHTCPRWWGQTAGVHLVKWDKCDKSLGRTFSECPHFKDKAQCWTEYDAEANE